MELNKYIIEQCKKEYPKVENALKEIKYEIFHYGDEIEKVKFTFGELCPIYCLCDGYYMLWYGDHGSFSFDCTWKTSLFNIRFNSPNYLFEKMDITSIDGSAGKYFNPNKCREDILNYLYESDWYEELSDYDKSRVKGFITSEKWCPDIDDYKLSSSVDKELVEDIRKLIQSTNDRYEFINEIREIDRDGSPFSECYELYNAGEEISYHFWLILLGLNYIYCKEMEKKEKGEENT